MSHSPNLLIYLIYLKEANEKEYLAIFYSKSFIIRVNNHGSKTICNQRYHFISNFRQLTHQHIKGIGGQIATKVQGAARWNIQDDEGRLNTLDIKESLYVPKSLISILCPQYWAEQAKDKLLT